MSITLTSKDLMKLHSVLTELDKFFETTATQLCVYGPISILIIINGDKELTLQLGFDKDVNKYCIKLDVC